MSNPTPEQKDAQAMVDRLREYRRWAKVTSLLVGRIAWLGLAGLVGWIVAKVWR